MESDYTTKVVMIPESILLNPCQMVSNAIALNLTMTSTFVS